MARLVSVNVYYKTKDKQLHLIMRKGPIHQKTNKNSKRAHLKQSFKIHITKLTELTKDTGKSSVFNISQ